jgi:putative transposase
LVEDNDEIYVEDLNLEGWKKLYGKAASDRSVGALVSMIEYKGELYGKSVVKISRWFPSSKACNECGCVLPELGLDVREWTCPDCGHVHDRDINAAKNILSVGQASRRDPASTGMERT